MELDRLEMAFRVYKNVKDSTLWDRISEYVETRTPTECKAKCVEMSQKDKQP
jgi:hypothetical protein